MYTKRYFSFQRAVQNLFASGKLEFNKSQEQAINYLSKLEEEIERNSNSSWYNWTDRKSGVYLYGNVGSGKTMLMDLFYSNTRINEKSRIHFNQFMLKFHFDLRNLRSECDSWDDPVKKLISKYCHETRLLCLDEFQVVDIADAMILRNLLSSFIEGGMIIVTTSNRHPDDLYLNGIQRSSFIPCIELIKSSLELIHLSSPMDYRERQFNNKSNHFVSPINDETDSFIIDKFRSLCKLGNCEPFNVYTMGRPIKIEKGELGNCSMFTFEELFEQSKSAADYIKICEAFPKIIVTKVPKFKVDERNEIRRFITFIDQVYEQKNELFIQSEIDIVDNLNIVKEELVSSFDESFSLNRTISRLKELSQYGK